MKKTKERRVLVIEDEKKVREDIERAFTMDGEFSFKPVIGVASVEEAIKVLEKEKRFDLLIIDWKLKDGKEGVEILKKRLQVFLPKIKIVFTAYASISDCVRAIRAGADDYIDKNQEDNLKKLLDAAKERLRERKYEENEPDDQWLEAHFDELYDNYYGELLAFIDGELIDHAKTERELREKVKQKYPDKEPFIMFAPMRVG